MGFTPAELKEAQRSLKSEQINWNAKKQQLERLINRDNLVLDELTAKLERLTSFVTEKNDEITALESKSRSYTAELGIKEQQLAHIDSKVQKSQTILADLEDVIEYKRARIDSELAEHSKQRRADYKREEAADEEAASRARQGLESLTIDANAKRDELNELRHEMAQTRLNFASETEQHQIHIQELKDRTMPLEAEIQGLESTVGQLERKRQLQLAETERAKQQHDNFVDYENRARKVLDTKDRELQDKAQEIAKEDRHLAARRSYLSNL